MSGQQISRISREHTLRIVRGQIVRFSGAAAAASVTTWSATEALKNAFKEWPTKILANRAGTNERTAENWRRGENGPSWSMVVRMLQDQELAPALLRAAGREDLADVDQVREKIRAARKALLELEE